MNGFVVTVNFKLKPGSMAEFRRLVDRNAIDSATNEQGCRRFDVLVPENNRDSVFLYEIYDDRSAFEAHLKTDHFNSFTRESAHLVFEKNIVQYALVCEGSIK